MKVLTVHKGFSLVEIIVFVAVFSIALVSLVASVAYASILLADARNKLIATRYSEELAEWLKFQREYNGYSTILDKLTVNPVTYCFNEADFSDWPVSSGDCGSDFSLGNIYQRSLTLTNPVGNPNRIDTVITTSWSFLQFNKNVTISLRFNNYEY